LNNSFDAGTDNNGFNFGGKNLNSGLNLNYSYSRFGYSCCETVVYPGIFE
jgi:hypothetical protein